MSEPRLLSEPSDGVPDVVDSQSGLEVAAQRLAEGHGPVGIDAERASGFRYGQRAFLLQFRRPGTGTVLLDPVGIQDFRPLKETLAGTEWILHAATQDLPCLAELGLHPDAIFDTELAARVLGLPKVGLASLTEDLLGISLAKTHGAADWSRRPLPAAWLNYAALDVELLHLLREELITRLTDAGRLDWAEQEFLALLDFKPRVHPEPWRRTSGMNAIRDPRKAAIVRGMWQAREDLARQSDRSPRRILPDVAIIAAAQREPHSLKALSEIPEFTRYRRRLVQWWRAIAAVNDLTAEELPGRPEPVVPPPRRTWERKNPEAAQRLLAVREFIVGRAVELNIPPEVLIGPDLVRKLAWEPPLEIDEAEIAETLIRAGARAWQVDQIASGLAAGLVSGSETVDDDEFASAEELAVEEAAKHGDATETGIGTLADPLV